MSRVTEKIRENADQVYKRVLRRKKPSMHIPIRSLGNVKYDPRKGYFEMKGHSKVRTLSVSTVKSFAQTLKMMQSSKDLVETSDFATKREMYYNSKGWGDACFKEQPESDAVMDDVEAMFQVNREQLGFIPEEKGGDIAGNLVVVDRDPQTRRNIRIDCTRFGSGAYSIPISVEHLRFESKAKFVLAIETAGMFERLNRHRFWQTAKCILISMGGVPTRACRRFIRRLAEDLKIPVYAFVDGDPYGYGNIYRTLKVGSGNAAHINKYFCVPNVSLLGVTPQDVIDYNLPTQPLKEIDIKRAEDMLKNDPFILHHKPWQEAIRQMVASGQRVEQQAFAAHNLNYVITDYLPEKLAHPSKFLP